MNVPLAHESEEFSNTIDTLIIAKELGLQESLIPREDYEHADTIVGQLVEQVVPGLKGLSGMEIGDYLFQHREQIFQIFDAFP